LIINISQKNIEIIKQHGEECYPHECCGLLLGTVKNQEKTVIKVVQTINDWENQKYLFTSLNTRSNSSLKDSFSINPVTFIEIQKQARQENLNIIGIYHSHPDHFAIFSSFDEAIAWDLYSYIIVSIKEGKSTDLFSWVLDSNGKFIEEKIQIICPLPPTLRE
jgi:proteasome lid subunit RPN8/RPN11